MKFLVQEKKGRIAYITLNRAEKRNALSHELIQELIDALEVAEKDESTKVVVIKANGKVFCAGADLAYLQKLQNYTYEENLVDSNHLKELFLKIYSLKKVVIAQVHGHAIAGGCGLATVCDFSFAVPEARFGYTEVKIGFVPALVSVFLARKIGEGKTRQLLLTGDLIDASVAKEWGLINWVVKEEELEAKVYSFAEELCSGSSGESLANTKEILSTVSAMDIATALENAVMLNARARSGKDFQRGIAAFLNKEQINW